MKTIFLLCLLSAATWHIASADIPRKAPLVKYTGLWTNSPFTSKPVVEAGGTIANPFDDFTLTGIAPVPGGYRITIINKKNPDIKKVIEPGGTDTEFKVVSVDRNPEKVLGTTVVLTTGSMEGTVSFERDQITLKPPPAAPEQGEPQANNNLPPGMNPIQANGAENVLRQPRPRIVPPPTPTTPAIGTATQDSSRDGRSRRRR
jgi:hypothetical protein